MDKLCITGGDILTMDEAGSFFSDGMLIIDRARNRGGNPDDNPRLRLMIRNFQLEDVAELARQAKPTTRQ